MSEDINTDELKENIRARKTWMRFIYMVLFAVILWVASFVVGVFIVLQFLHKLLLGRANDHMLRFSQGLSTWIYQILVFMFFNSEAMPFPFDDFPKGVPGGSPGSGGGSRKKASKKKSASRTG